MGRVMLKWEIIALSLEKRGSMQRDCNKQLNQIIKNSYCVTQPKEYDSHLIM